MSGRDSIDRMARSHSGLKRLPGVAATTVAALAAFAFAGCTAAVEDNAGWKEPVVPEAVPVFTSASTLPFDAYALGRAEREQLQRGTASLLSTCAKQYGMDVGFSGDYLQQPQTDPAHPFWFAWGGPVGTLDAAQAAQYGYMAPPDAPWTLGMGFYLDDPANLQPLPLSDPTESARVRGVMYGPDQAFIIAADGSDTLLPPEQLPTDAAGALPPDGGCYGVVEAQIAVPFVDTNDVRADVISLSLSDPRVVERTDAWTDCMSKAGYDYARVDEGISMNSGVTPETIAAALQDVECTATSRWPDMYYFVLADYQNQAIQREPDLFASSRSAEQKRLARVNELTR